MLLATLENWLEYRTYAHIAVGFELSESQIFRIVKWVEEVLIKDGTFSLPGKKGSDWRRDWLWGNSFRLHRISYRTPKKRQRKWYSGKKKRHTLKTLVVVCKKTRKIICVFCCNGKKHDFRLFKESAIHMAESIKVKVDKGFIGICDFHKNSELPKRGAKNAR